ncbi:M14 family metallopeptidase [Oceanospirillum linum]|uniref:M14 family metallopeptidase n=1 Tax=Oceanospirillum linum TaxID=966 RepID=UPI00089F66AB|nr:M14-type cytosolic carboxypeptidase [Oceanospirillum linum]SEG14386.1 Murein tripeptide amidase MpaA [Oleiphilus messinensis]SMP10684.1 Murein tripeptide amidase MpaA [Oceanospirillum linum]
MSLTIPSRIKISSQFDAGNVEVLDLTNPKDIQLSICHDNQSDFFQWFHFRVQGAATQPLNLRIVNAGQAAYVDGWPDYRAVASYDRETWFRVDTAYEADTGELVIQHTPAQNSIYFAYFAPYSWDQHLDLIGQAQQSALCEVHDIGTTLDGYDLNLLKISKASDDPTAKKQIWVTARQHPGETMAEWCAEGFIARLLDEDDALGQSVLEQADLYIVPNMNPDGSIRGHLRTNACGANLNREWETPTPERSPEVLAVRTLMQQSGVDLFLDLHGDEALPCNFIAGQEGAPHLSPEVLAQENSFKQDLEQINPDFQTARGYPPGKFGPETYTIAAFWVGREFNCPSMTLEMPFKDYDNRPDADFGWSPERSVKLGESLLYPVHQWLQAGL